MSAERAANSAFEQGSFPLSNAISPCQEMEAYETLCAVVRNANPNRLHALFEKAGDDLPTRALDAWTKHHHEAHGLFAESLEAYAEPEEAAEEVRRFLATITQHFSVCVHGTFQWPKMLCDAEYPLRLFYYRGELELALSRCVSVVGARKASPDGLKRAAKLAKGLVDRGYTVVSGLAEGIDTAAMTAAIESGGRTVGVIGTPITESYPAKNRKLQAQVGCEHLLMSQVPFYRYFSEPFQTRKLYFPQRNETMAALSMATVIVEASETSGTHSQARACLKQGRKLFILNSCFEDRNLTWPARYESEGAIRVRDLDGVFSHLDKICSVSMQHADPS